MDDKLAFEVYSEMKERVIFETYYVKRLLDSHWHSYLQGDRSPYHLNKWVELATEYRKLNEQRYILFDLCYPR